jgi:hypothetical protein
MILVVVAVASTTAIALAAPAGLHSAMIISVAVTTAVVTDLLLF